MSLSLLHTLFFHLSEHIPERDLLSRLSRFSFGFFGTCHLQYCAGFALFLPDSTKTAGLKLGSARCRGFLACPCSAVPALAPGRGRCVTQGSPRVSWAQGSVTTWLTQDFSSRSPAGPGVCVAVQWHGLGKGVCYKHSSKKSQKEGFLTAPVLWFGPGHRCLWGCSTGWVE